MGDPEATLSEEFLDLEGTTSADDDYESPAFMELLDTSDFEETKKELESQWQTAGTRGRRQREKYLWERELCDAETILQFADGSPAPRVQTFEDGPCGYQVTSANSARGSNGPLSRPRTGCGAFSPGHAGSSAVQYAIGPVARVG